MASNIDVALVYYLTHDAGLVALIGARVHPLKLPQGSTIPALTYQDISALDTSQAHGEPGALPAYRYQFTAYGISLGTVVAIMKALKLALDGYRGFMGAGATVTEVQAIKLKDQRSLDDDLTGLYIRQQDYYVHVKE